MTVKKRLFWSNILMILVPVVSATLVGILCIVIIWTSFIHGTAIGVKDQEDFDHACIALTEIVEQKLDFNKDLNSLEALLDNSEITLKIIKDVCEDFNVMAERLKESVNQPQQQEHSRKELIAGISHDIRSPLTSIQAYVEGLLDGIAKTPETERRYLKTIKTKAEVLDHIISQLFLFSKMELGEYNDKPCEFALDEMIHEIILASQEEYSQKGLHIETALEPFSIYADSIHFQRIITNILDNSLKYKTKETCHMQIPLQQTINGHQLSFADDGPGVPEDALPHLFEVFYRSDPARQNPDNGSGLGLAIVANAVHQMNGSVTALPCKPTGLEIQINFPSEVK